MDRVAQRIFRLSTRIGKPKGIKGLSSEVSGPEFSTSVGIVKFIAKQIYADSGQENKEERLPIQKDKKLLKKLRSWIVDNI